MFRASVLKLPYFKEMSGQKNGQTFCSETSLYRLVFINFEDKDLLVITFSITEIIKEFLNSRIIPGSL